MPNLLEKYRKTVIPAMQSKFNIKNNMAVPMISKVVINTGMGKMIKDDKFLEKMERDLALLSGQKPVYRKAKKSIAGFKSREGMNIALMLTLRGKRMYDFMDRFINIALPRARDFRGIDAKNLDRGGSLNMGIKEHNIFPEITYESLKDIFGLEITFTTNAKDRDRGMELFKLMGFPMKKN